MQNKTCYLDDHSHGLVTNSLSVTKRPQFGGKKKLNSDNSKILMLYVFEINLFLFRYYEIMFFNFLKAMSRSYKH